MSTQEQLPQDFEQKTDSIKPEQIDLRTSSMKAILQLQKLSDREFDTLISSLPDMLKKPVEIFSYGSERIIMLYSAIVSAGGLIPNVFGYYKDALVNPNLFLGVVAPPGSNKGLIKYARKLVLKVHKHIRSESSLLLDTYNEELNKYNISKKSGALAKQPSKPPYRSPLISGNITSAKLMQQLEDNIGMPSLIIDSEIDSVANSATGEHGNQLSQLFRKIFEHESISQQLKGGNQHYEIDRTFMAIILAGTFKQLLTLVGNIENGLLSRFMLITVNDGAKWQSVAPSINNANRDQLIDQYADEYFEFWKFHSSLNLQVELPMENWDILDAIGERELSYQYNLHHENMAGNVKRTVNMAYRICQILTAVRQWENGGSGSCAMCSQVDFETALKLTGHFYRCSIEFFNLLPGGGTSGMATAKEKFLDALPLNFCRADAIAIAVKQKLTVRTADRFLKDLTTGKYLEKPSSGQYAKVPLAKLATSQSDEDIDL